MSSTNITEEEKKKYEKEFLDFLIERIQDAGGSIQFQYLSGHLQQVRFEVKVAWGATKSELMKFLKSHPNNFKVDSKGFITVIDSPKLDYESIVLKDENSHLDSRNTLPLRIENGKGVVVKISPEFGLIYIEEPAIAEYVYFTPQNYNDDKESLFINHDLEISSEVHFNAVYSRDELEVQYLASKVWKTPCENAHPEGIKENISKYGHKNANTRNETDIYDKDSTFSKDSKSVKKRVHIKNSEIDYIKLPSLSEQSKKNSTKSNELVNKDSKPPKELVKDVKNSEKACTKLPFHSDTSKKDFPKKSKLVNHPGKICPYDHGAVIKFGKDDSEIAEGDACDYFLYGSKVSDIRWEFSDYQNVFFDAIPIKTHPYWKAILVWVGEKPTVVTKTKTYVKKNESYEGHSCESDASIESSDSLSKSKISKFKSSNFSTEAVKKKSNISFDHCTSKKDLQSKSSFQKSLLNKVRKKKDESKYKKRDSLKYKNKVLSRESTTKLTENSSTEDSESIFSTREIVTDVTQVKSIQNSSEDCNEFVYRIHNSKDFQKENYKHSLSAMTFKFKSSSEEENSSVEENDKPRTETLDNKAKSSIRIFEDIKGEITRLHCKAAFLCSPQLQREINFIINAFYLDGSCIEDQHVIDLKEVLKVGDHVNFNCFIIIDDIGHIYQNVTMAWKGRKPENIHEMTPQEFIVENDLSVSNNKPESINSDYADEYLSQKKLSYMNNLPEQINDISDENDTTESDNFITKNASDDSYVLEDANDITCNSNYISEDANGVADNTNYISEDDGLEHYTEPKIKIYEKSDLILSSDYKLLSEKIIQTLKSKCFISLDPKVDLNAVVNEVTSILNKSSTKDQDVPLKSRYSCDSSEVVCLKCSKSPKSRSRKMTCDAEVQTIITGEIVATREKFSLLSKNRKKKQ